ncbi:ribonuclease M5 [Eubacterium minutum ATCC 700079]|nr:ribonuclease M5 [Eubacterium minutum ATCC 700079]
MKQGKIKIEEIIVVEGRDDTAAIKRAVTAQTIETHGFGMNEEMWKRIDRAYKSCGVVLFTDPDRAGENIRRKIKERYPLCKEAFLPRREAVKKGNLGIENAAPETIVEALLKTRSIKSAGLPDEDAEEKGERLFTVRDMDLNGLSSGKGSRKKREKIGEMLGIGYGNAKTFLSKLNGYGVTREEFYGAVQSIGDTRDKE